MSRGTVDSLTFELVAKLLEAQIVTLETLHRLERKIDTMTDTVQAQLDSAVSTITTAVNDASAAIKDLATKLAQASSLNPGDVQTAAAKLTQIAAGLEAVVAAAGEPVSEEPPVEPASPPDGASANDGAPPTQPEPAPAA